MACTNPHRIPRAAAGWWLAALALGVAGFFGVRAWPPGQPSDGLPRATAVPLPQSSRDGRSLDTGLSDALATAVPLERRLKLLEVVGRTAPGDLRRLFQDPRATQRDRRMIAQRWAEVDPPGMFGFLKSLRRSQWDRESALLSDARNILFQTWVRADPEAALAAARQVERLPSFRGLNWEIGLALLAVDPAKALAVMENARAWDGSPVPEALWKEDPAAFVRLADQASSQVLHEPRLGAAFTQAFAAWAKADSASAAQWLKNLPPGHQRALWTKLVGGLAEADPAAAQAWFASLPPSSTREKAGAALVAGWARTDPGAAVAWLQDNLHGGRSEAFSGLARALTEKGVDAAMGLLDAMPPGPERDGVVTTIARTWAKKDFQPAIAWVASLPADDPGKRRAIDDLSYDWSRLDLAGAAAFVTAEAGQGAAASLLHSVAQRFATTDPAAGVAWAVALPENTRQQQEALDRIMGIALSHDRLPQALEALQTHSPALSPSAVSRLVAEQLRSHHGEAGNTDLAQRLRQIPPAWRDTARQAVDNTPDVPADRRAAALDALK